MTALNEHGPTQPTRSLREALQASGAQPNSRLSVLSRFMFDHYDEVHALKVVERYSWRDIVAGLAKLPDFAGAPSQVLTVTAAKLVWSRTNQRRRQDAAVRSGTAKRPQITHQIEPVAQAFPPGIPSGSGALLSQEAPSQMRDGLTQDSVSGSFSIRPVLPGDALFASPWVEKPDASADYSLDETEVDRRIANLAMRQRDQKIPPPEML